MALDALRESLDKVETHLDNREFEKVSHVGYQEVAHNFVYVQRTLAGLQTSSHHKKAFISNIAQEASVAYEDVASCVEQKMQSSVLSGLLVNTILISPVLAATHKPAKMTCEEFVLLDDLAKPKMVYWNEASLTTRAAC